MDVGVLERGNIVIGSECECWFSEDGSQEIELSGNKAIDIESTIDEPARVELSVDLAARTWVNYLDNYARSLREGTLTESQVAAIVAIINGR